MKLSKLIDNVNAQIIEVDDMKALAQVITLTNWAPGIFRDNYRKLANFETTDLIGLDIDGGCTIEDAQKLFNSYQHVIATTKSHRKEKNGVTCDRFRVVLKLSTPITNARTYTSTYLGLGVAYPFIDLACADASRQFYSSMSVVSIQSTGKTIQPEDKGAVSKATIEFLEKGAEQGKWNATLYKAAKDLQQQGYDEQSTTELLKRPTGKLDGKDLKTIESAFRSEARHPARIESDDGPLRADQWVGQWILKKKLEINFNEQIKLDGKALNFTQIQDRLIIDTASVGLKFSQDLLFAALRIHYDTSLDMIVQRTIDELSYEYSDTNHVGRFILALEGKENLLSEAVIKHFIWSVKRKMKNKQVVHHLMPVIVGKTNAGKTFAIRRLLKPLFTLTSEKRLDIVNDERQAFNFSKYYVIVFDEMGRAAKADVECLKNTITSETISYRMMKSNKNAVSANISTFIGSSNIDVKNLVNDPTSARRYYQLKHADVIDREAINSIDYLAMWKSVDENSESPIIPFLSELAIAQEGIRSKTLIEEWVEDECIPDPEKGTPKREALREFNEWVKANNLKTHYRPNRFYEEMKALVEEKRIDNKRVFAISVKMSTQD